MNFFRYFYDKNYRVYGLRGFLQILLPFVAVYYLTFIDFNIYLTVAGIITGYLLSMAVAIGYHRILCHRVANINNYWKVFFCWTGTIGVNAPPISWVSNHILHHHYADTNKDPHSPIINGKLRNLFFLGHKKKTEIFKQMTMTERKKWITSFKHLTKSEVVVFFEKYYLLAILSYVFALYLISPAAVIYFWVIPVIYVQLMETLLVNNHGGMLGGKIEQWGNQAADNYFLSFLVYGEHEHSKHHRNPRGDEKLNMMIRKVFVR